MGFYKVRYKSDIKSVIVSLVLFIMMFIMGCRLSQSAPDSNYLCTIKQKSLALGLTKYMLENGDYPDSLEAYFRKYKLNKSAIICPSDNRTVYLYFRPPTKATASFIVFECSIHTNHCFNLKALGFDEGLMEAAQTNDSTPNVDKTAGK